jgi:hypothetical protein
VAGKHPTTEDRSGVIRVALTGIASGVDVGVVLQELAALHPRHTLFPGDLLLELGADALAEAGVSRDDRLDYEGIRERYLPECEFRGKTDHYKSHYALRAAAMIRAGIQPDLAGEAAWWNGDDLWVFAYYALVVYLRAAADRSNEGVRSICARIAAHHNLPISALQR